MTKYEKILEDVKDSGRMARRLTECENFIKNAPREYKANLQEFQLDYEKSCRNYERTKNRATKECERMLAEGRRKGYSDEQLRNIRNGYQEEIDIARETMEQDKADLLKMQEAVERLPKMLEEAEAEKRELEAKLGKVSASEHQSDKPEKKRSGFFDIFAWFFWIVVIVVAVRSCS